MGNNKQRKIGECYECGVQGQLVNIYPTLQGDSVNLTFRHGLSKICEYREHDFTILGKAMEYEFQEVEGEEKTNLDLFIAQYNKIFEKPMFKNDIHSCQICKESIGEKNYSIVHSECLDNFDLDCPMFRMASFSEVVKTQKKQIQLLIEKYNSYKKYSSGKIEDLLEEIDYDITCISHFFDNILN